MPTIQRINREADARTIEKIAEGGGDIINGVAFEMIPLPEPATILSYNHIPYRTASGEVEYTRSAEIIEIEGVANYQSFRPIRSATMPRSYLFPAELTDVAEKLRQHGIQVDRISSNMTLEVEAFSVTGQESQSFVQNGHSNTRLTGEYQTMERSFQVGDFRVSLETPLANLIFYLLEPEADDGLAYWNFFDEYLAEMGGAGRPVDLPGG